MADSDNFEYSRGEPKKNARLDMKHGFIHHIRRNQVKRDEYDKEFEANKKVQSQNRRSGGRRDRKPEQRVYKPPYHKGQSPKAAYDDNKLLFILNYCDKEMNQHKVNVYENDDEEIIANKLYQLASIPDDLLETLTWKIKQEKIKRIMIKNKSFA